MSTPASTTPASTPRPRPTLLLAVSAELQPKLFSPRDLARLDAHCRLLPARPSGAADAAFLDAHLGQADVILTSWGTAALDAERLARAPKLAFLAHAAGSVKPVVSDALWQRGIQVSSAAAAIAFGVAEFCLGLMLTAPKRAFWAGIATRQGEWSEGIKFCHGPQEIYQQTIGIIGAGHVGRHLARLLRHFTCDVLMFDPYCPAATLAELGATRVDTLDELFTRCRVVSLNAPSTEETRHLIRGRHLALLPDGALFINTARGAIVHEEEMIDELRKNRFVACIDVTDPAEPPPADHPLRRLPNVWLTPHEAGTVAQNMLRIGTFAADEVLAFAAGAPRRYAVTQEQLARIG